jgi:hypothetical protein
VREASLRTTRWAPWELGARDEGKTVAAAADDPGLTESLAPMTQLTRADNLLPFGEKTVQVDFVAINGISRRLHAQRLSVPFRVIGPTTTVRRH